MNKLRAACGLLGAALLVMTGCEDGQYAADVTIPIPTSADLTESSSAKESDADSENRIRTFHGLSLRIPVGWKQVELSDFQKGVIDARYEIPEHGDELTLTISSAGGGIDANFDRWRGQVSAGDEETDQFDVPGRTVRWIELTGRFSGGFGKEPQDNWQLTGAAIPNAGQDMYLKLTGPIDQTREARDEVRALAKSVRSAP